MDQRLLKKLRWRCRRGTQELDALLGSYLNTHGSSWSEAQTSLFSQLLDREDDQLWDWLSGQVACPEKSFQALIDDIRSPR